MTTKITVDAHAGWPVRVTRIEGAGQSHSIVEPNSAQDFYIHSTLDLRIHEVQSDETPTFGQKAVGASFNPSSLPQVDRLKALYAEDHRHLRRRSRRSGDAVRSGRSLVGRHHRGAGRANVGRQGLDLAGLSHRARALRAGPRAAGPRPG